MAQSEADTSAGRDADCRDSCMVDLNVNEKLLAFRDAVARYRTLCSKASKDDADALCMASRRAEWAFFPRFLAFGGYDEDWSQDFCNWLKEAVSLVQIEGEARKSMANRLEETEALTGLRGGQAPRDHMNDSGAATRTAGVAKNATGR